MKSLNRMPLVKRLNKLKVGFSSTLMFIVWSVWGGFILHILLSNYLAVLTKPVYDKPIRNIDDLLGMEYVEK